MPGADPEFGVRGDEIRQSEIWEYYIIIVSDVYGTYDAETLR